MNIKEIIEYIPKTLTDTIVKLMDKAGYTVSARWVSILYFFIVFMIIYMLLKSESINTIVKIIIFLLAIILLGGIFLPTW